MQSRNSILSCLEQSPVILADLAAAIPEAERKPRRIAAKWSIHEHLCHLADVQPMLRGRFEQFRDEESPRFEPYLPGNTASDEHLLAMDWDQALETFATQRGRLLAFLRELDESIWLRRAQHSEYRLYSPDILLRHVLMHDHLHMYRIEELWLSEAAYLSA